MSEDLELITLKVRKSMSQGIKLLVGKRVCGAG